MAGASTENKLLSGKVAITTMVMAILDNYDF